MKSSSNQPPMQFGPTQNDAETRVERIWKTSEVLIEEATSEASHNREQGSILLRWAVTTCLTINAGALVATLNASEFDVNSRLWSGIWFLVGVVIALMVSAILASAFLKMAHSKSALVKDVKLALKLKDLEKLEGIDGSTIRGSEALGGFAFFLSFMSVVAFIVGAAIMIEGAA